MIGPAMANGPVLAAATEYTVIRALGFPAALPSRAEMQRLLSFIVPMLVALCSRVSMGLSITIGATALGTVALAANQVVESVYWLFCPIGEAISLCMQTYLPSVLAARRRAGAQMRRRCERASTCAGLVAGAAAGLSVVVRPGLFTTCGAVAGSMARAAPVLAASIFTFTRMCGLEGSMIARKQMKQLALTHATLAVVLIAALRRATRTAGCE